MIPLRYTFSLTIVFFYEYARGRYALNGRVTFSGLAYLVFPFPESRATGSCTHMFPSRFHVSPLLYRYGRMTCPRILVRFPFPLLSLRLVRLRFSLMSVLFRLVDSSQVLTVTAYAFPFAVCRLISRLVIYGL